MEILQVNTQQCTNTPLIGMLCYTGIKGIKPDLFILKTDHSISEEQGIHILRELAKLKEGTGYLSFIPFTVYLNFEQTGNIALFRDKIDDKPFFWIDQGEIIYCNPENDFVEHTKNDVK